MCSETFTGHGVIEEWFAEGLGILVPEERIEFHQAANEREKGQDPPTPTNTSWIWGASTMKYFSYLH